MGFDEPPTKERSAMALQISTVPTGLMATPAIHAMSISQPVAIAAAVVVGGLLAVILVVWLARRVLHRLIGLGVSALVALATHSGTQAWIDHLIATHHG